MKIIEREYLKDLYDKYMKTHLTQAEKDYLEIMGEDIKKLI